MDESTIVSFELWQLLSMLVGIGAVFTGLGKLLLFQHARHIDERFDGFAAKFLALEQADIKEQEALRSLERDLLRMQAELPEKYVRREDYIRGQTVIEAKLDAISSEVKLVQIQGAKRAN